MQNIRTIQQNTQQSLTDFTFNPQSINPSMVFCRVTAQAQKDCVINIQIAEQYKRKLKKQKFTKNILQLGALSLLALPAKALLAMNLSNSSNTNQSALPSKELVVATLKDNPSIFQDGDMLHGFGYDIAKRYADYLGVDMRLQTYQDSQSLAHALKTGQADMALSLNQIADNELVTSAIACDADTKTKLNQHGLDSNLHFTFSSKNQATIDHSTSFLCSKEQQIQTQTIAGFYDRTLLQNDYSKKHFHNALNHKLPKYESAFKTGAKQHNHDWQVLAAIGYQESHLNPEAVSPTGVQGLMMLTQDTAKEMGVEDRTDALQSIQGSAKYLENLDKQFSDIDDGERIWFVLAAYNMGPNAIKRIQKTLDAEGKNGNSWSEIYAYLADNADSNSRFVQCMQYVTNIRTYLEAIKTEEIA